MRYLLDTNVLVSATSREMPGHTAAVDVVERTLEGTEPWCLTWVNVYEFLRIATHPRIFPTPLRWADALRQVQTLLDHPSIEVLNETERHASVLETAVRTAGGASGNFVHDCHIAALLIEHDVRCIVTGDAHFRRFPDLIVLTPEEFLSTGAKG